MVNDLLTLDKTRRLWYSGGGYRTYVLEVGRMEGWESGNQGIRDVGWSPIPRFLIP
jgi:hypothetical protein